jgi:hypothetical protein
MSTDTFDTFETPRRSSDTADDTLELDRPKRRDTTAQLAASWKLLTARLASGTGSAGTRLKAGWAALAVHTKHARSSAENSRYRSMNAAIALVWSIAVVLLSIELALAVSPVLGVLIALTAGIVVGAGGRRLAMLVQTREPRRAAARSQH